MKILLFIISLFFFSCSERDVDQEIRDKIKEFYEVGEVKHYKPISYSKLDTIKNIRRYKDGSIIWVTGKITHTFYAKSNNGNILLYVDKFNVTITKDVVIAIPLGYD